MAFRDIQRILGEPRAAIADGSFGRFGGQYIYGYNGAVSTTEETVWQEGGAYTHPASASTMTVSSDDAGDAAAGVGATEVTITGLDSNYAVVVESVTMNGTTAVTTTNSFLRINTLEVTNAGSTGENAGVVYIGTGTVTSGKPANVFGLIEKGENQSLHGFWTVPAGFTAYIMRQVAISHGNAASVAEISLRVRRFGLFFRTINRFKLTRGSIQIPFYVPLKLEERTDFQVRAIADTGNIDVSQGLDLLITSNT